MSDDVVELAHSPLGASSAERWMNCPGSNIILKQLDLPQTDEKDFQKEGHAGHEAAAHALENALDGWELVGQTFHDVEITDVMAAAIQVYLDSVRPEMVEGATIMIEKRIGLDHEGNRPHKAFYGTVDFAAYSTNKLVVTDLKFGEGIIVEPEWNSQMMYYAYGILIQRPKVREDREVILRIVQPRAFHPDGQVREWATTAGEIINWAETKLLPAMAEAEIDGSLDTGKWCRFCPAKLHCPLLQGLFGAAAKADPKALPNFSNKRIGLEYQQREAVKHYLKALEDETYRRLMTGGEVPGTKLVYKKANRVFKEGAIDVFRMRFGAEAFTKPEMKSPAELEKLDPTAKELVKEWAFMPKSGLTVALQSDTKPAVKVEKVQDIFAHMIPADEA